MTPSRLARLTAIAAFSLAAACAGDPAATTTPVDAGPLFAKPAPLPSMQFLFPASGYGLLGDGLPYSDGVCGITAVMNSDTSGVTGAFGTLDPSCGRQPVTLILQSRHLGVDANGNDIDDVSALPIVSQVGNMKFHDGGNGLIDAMVINSVSCLHRGKNGRYAGVGLRFQSADYPGSDDLTLSISGTNVWQIASQPYPDNIAYCDGDATGGVSYWHVAVSITVSPK